VTRPFEPLSVSSLGRRRRWRKPRRSSYAKKVQALEEDEDAATDETPER
jgi:hypothetical protein